VATLHLCIARNVPAAAALLVATMYLSPTTVALLPCMVTYLVTSECKRHGAPVTIATILATGMATALILHKLSLLATSNPSWYEHTYGPYATAPSPSQLDVSSNVYWYLHASMFPRFVDYFSLTLTLLPYTLMLPICIRFNQRQGEFGYTNTQLSGILLSYGVTRLLAIDGNASDYYFLLSLMFIDELVVERMTFVGLIVAVSSVVPLLLQFLDLHLWICTGSGNGNYLYFQNLAFNVFYLLGILEYGRRGVERVVVETICRKEKVGREKVGKKH
jgi:phosphatidylinositol glycan class U